MDKSITKILLIKHGAFGDLIQADGIFHDLRLYYANAEIVLLTMSRYKELMQQSPYIDRVIVDNRVALWHVRNQLKLRQKLRDENIDLVIDLQNSNRSSLYQRYFLPNSPWFSRRSSLNGVSGLQGLKQLLEQHQIPITFALKPNVSWMAANVDELLEKANVDKPYIALIPGCSAQHPEKRWPYFSKLSARLVEQGFRVVNVLGPDELSMADDLSGYTPSKDKGILSWFEMAGILKHAQYVIGNDTGPSHVASCLGTPGIALFSEHTSVDRSEIQRDSFLTYQVDELKNLSVDTLLSIITPHLD